MSIQPTDDSITARYNLDDVDKRILKLFVDFPGIKQGAIAKEVGISRRGVNLRMQKPAFRLAVKDKLATADELLKKGLDVSLRRMIDIIEFGTAREATEAAKVIAVLASGRIPGQQTNRDAPPVEGMIFRTRIGQDGLVNRSMEEVHSSLPAATQTIDAEVVDVD
jgi:hypothetical protein